MAEEVYNEYADVRLLLGPQRSGKTATGVALAKDDYYAHLTGIQPDGGGPIIRASCLTTEDKAELREKHITPNIFKYVRVYSQDGRSKLVAIPDGWHIISSVKLFANFHLYHLKYVLLTMADVLEFVNHPTLFYNCWILSDESAWTDPRNSMTVYGKAIASFGATVGKRNIHFLQMTQYNEMIERRYRLFGTHRYSCSYDKKTKMVTVNIKKHGEPEKTSSFWLPYYWHNFRSNEVIPIPDHQLARALVAIGAKE